jgi:hypothetical protein
MKTGKEWGWRLVESLCYVGSRIIALVKCVLTACVSVGVKGTHIVEAANINTCALS